MFQSEQVDFDIKILTRKIQIENKRNDFTMRLFITIFKHGGYNVSYQ